MTKILKPMKACTGEITAIASKSDAHRRLICACLADTEIELILAETSEDIEATISCLIALGAVISREGDTLYIKPIENVPENPVLDCRESGSTFRFMLPVALSLCDSVSFTGSGRLPKRPISDLMDCMAEHGITFSSDTLPFTASGKLTCGTYKISGDVSSQYITGLLLALSFLDGESEIVLTSTLQSASYVDITLNVLADFGANVEICGTGYKIYKKSSVIMTKQKVDSDWSNIAFFTAIGAIREPIKIYGLDIKSPQGDKALLKILQKFGAFVVVYDDYIEVSPQRLRGCTIDVSDCPDLVPAMAIIASFSRGQTKFINAERLRMKESDRIKSTATMLRSLGGEATSGDDYLIVHGTGLSGGRVKSQNDHRIVMAAAIASCFCENDIIIENAEAVNKSYPKFFYDFQNLGGEIYE